MLTDKNKERMEREKVITLLRLVKENGLKIDIAADEICSLFNVVEQSEQLCKKNDIIQSVEIIDGGKWIKGKH